MEHTEPDTPSACSWHGLLFRFRWFMRWLNSYHACCKPAPHPLQVLLRCACEGALTGMPPDKDPLVAKSYEVRKLSTWAANPEKMRTDVGLIEPLVNLMREQDMVTNIAEAEVDANYGLEWPYHTSAYLSDAAAVFDNKEQAMSFLGEMVGEELAHSTLQSLQISLTSVESKIEAFIVDSQATLESAAGALRACLAAFSVDSPRSEADEFQALDAKAKDALAKAKRSAAKLNKHWPADLEEYRKLNEAHEDTKRFIIAWGACDLLRRPGASHPMKGKQIREALKTLYLGAVKDDDNKFLDCGVKVQIEKLISMDTALAADASSSPAAAASSSVEPPPKRQKVSAKVVA